MENVNGNCTGIGGKNQNNVNCRSSAIADVVVDVDIFRFVFTLSVAYVNVIP